MRLSQLRVHNSLFFSWSGISFFYFSFFLFTLFVWCVLHAWTQKGFLGSSPTQSQTQGKSSHLTSGALGMGKEQNHSFIHWPPQDLIPWYMQQQFYPHKISVSRAYIQRNSLKYTASVAHQLLAKLFPKACSADHQFYWFPIYTALGYSIHCFPWYFSLSDLRDLLDFSSN